MLDVTMLPRPRFIEVGPRDGLQNEVAVVPTEAKVAFIDALAQSGIREISAGAFAARPVSPQMADSAEVFDNITRRSGVTYSALVLDETGLDAALNAEADKIEIICAATETFSKLMSGASIAYSLERLRPIVGRARREKLPVRACVATVFHCPYEGQVRPETAVAVVDRLRAMGVAEISLADTIGRASPQDVRALADRLLKRVPAAQVVMHFHDTYGMAVANAMTAWGEYGIAGFDASCGGVGGCPYAPGVGGNVATEDLAFAFLACGAPGQLDFRILRSAGQALAAHLGHTLPSHLSKIEFK
ncbi:MAG: hydroxymethylglutaryl-CoA lyase [Elusimicrobiota bacterium]|jgi:isopropylmalate/homocitrate/citramalate synthase